MSLACARSRALAGALPNPSHQAPTPSPLTPLAHPAGGLVGRFAPSPAPSRVVANACAPVGRARAVRWAPPTLGALLPSLALPSLRYGFRSSAALRSNRLRAGLRPSRTSFIAYGLPFALVGLWSRRWLPPARLATSRKACCACPRSYDCSLEHSLPWSLLRRWGAFWQSLLLPLFVLPARYARGALIGACACRAPARALCCGRHQARPLRGSRFARHSGFRPPPPSGRARLTPLRAPRSGAGSLFFLLRLELRSPHDGVSPCSFLAWFAPIMGGSIARPLKTFFIGSRLEPWLPAALASLGCHRPPRPSRVRRAPPRGVRLVFLGWVVSPVPLSLTLFS